MDSFLGEVFKTLKEIRVDRDRLKALMVDGEGVEGENVANVVI